MAYSNAFARTGYPQSLNYPQGWKPPFQGAPPMPQGYGYNSNQWNNGFWSYNANHQQSNQQNAWQPSRNWQYPGQHGPQQGHQNVSNFNPNKRPVKPPSAEYLATKLVDNPLGLTNMVPREQVYAGQTEDEAHTPWVWNPRGLVEADEEDSDIEAVITATYRDDEGRRLEPRGPMPTRKPPSRQASVEPHEPPHSASLMRHHTEPTNLYQQNASTLSRHQSEPPLPHPPLSAPVGATSSASQSFGPSQRRNSSVEAPRNQIYQNGVSSASQQANAHHQRANTLPSCSTPPEGFTSQGLLRPTFSPNIIRTPEHYKNKEAAAARRHSVDSIHNSPTPHSQSRGSYNTMLSNRMNGMHLEDSSRHTGSERHQSSNGPSSSQQQSSSTMSGTGVFVDEPSQMLSPLVLGTPLPSARSLGRHHTAPNLSPLDAIPETSPEQQYQTPTRQKTLRSKSKSREVLRSPPNSAAAHNPSLFVPPHGPSGSSVYSNQPLTHASQHNYPHSQQHSGSSSNLSRQNSLPATYLSPPTSTSTPAGSYRRHSTTPSNSAAASPAPSPGSNANHHYSPPLASKENVRDQARHTYPGTSQSSQTLPPTSSDSPSRSRYTHPLSGPLDLPPASDRPRRRKGFWNRRGDHLLTSPELRIVYAPTNRQDPAELSDYPRWKEGFRDEFGTYFGWSDTYRELQDSIPRHGKPPIRPYDSFIQYDRP